MATSMAFRLRIGFLKHLLKLRVTETLAGSKPKFVINVKELQCPTVSLSTRRRLFPTVQAFFGGNWQQTGQLRAQPADRATDPTSISKRQYSGSGGEDGDGGKQRLRLMDFPEIIWPHVLKSLRNFFFSFLIRGYIDHDYTPLTFLAGAEQAVARVSNLISCGNFESLEKEGLVTREVVREIRQNYQQLSPKQREFVAVNTKDLFFRFIYEIGMIFDDETDQRFIEITTVFQGIQGLELAREQEQQNFSQHQQDQVYVCNYRFVREYTKGKDDSWTINKLNHFSPKEIVANTSIFRR